MKSNTEVSFLKGWKLKLGVLMAILVPAVTATGSFYKFQIEINNKISNLELQNERNFAKQTTLEKLDNNVNMMKDDLIEIKTILKRKLK